MGIKSLKIDEVTPSEIWGLMVQQSASNPEFFGIKFPESRKFREILKKARRGFSMPPKAVWDCIRSFEHRLDTLTTLLALLCSLKLHMRPWGPEYFGETHPEFLKISDFCPNLQHGVSSESSQLAR